MEKSKDKNLKIKNIYKKELLLCEKNWKICNKQWDYIREEYEHESIKTDIKEMKICFEEIINLKNQELSTLIQGLEDIQNQTDFLVAVKISAFDKLIDLYESRNNYYRRRHLQQISELNENSLREENEITELFKKSKEKLNFLLSHQDDHCKEMLQSVRNTKFETIFEWDSEHAAEMEELEEELQSNMEWVLIKLQTTLKTYFYQNRYKRMEYKELKDRDVDDHKTIFGNFDRAKHLQKKINVLRVNWKLFNKEFLNDLKDKKIKLFKKYLQIQQSYDLAMKNDQLQLKILSHEAAQSVKFLQDVSKRGERFLVMKRLCSIFQNSREKCVRAEQDSNIAAIEKTQLFWNKLGILESMLPELKNEIRQLQAEKTSMKKSLGSIVQIFFKSLK